MLLSSHPPPWEKKIKFSRYIRLGTLLINRPPKYIYLPIQLLFAKYRVKIGLFLNLYIFSYEKFFIPKYSQTDTRPTLVTCRTLDHRLTDGLVYLTDSSMNFFGKFISQNCFFYLNNNMNEMCFLPMFWALKWITMTF